MCEKSQLLKPRDPLSMYAYTPEQDTLLAACFDSPHESQRILLAVVALTLEVLPENQVHNDNKKTR